MSDPLEILRKRFPANKIGKLPKLTCSACVKKQCQEHKRRKCETCGNYISTAHLHLDYVGHATITERLIEADPLWDWEPVGVDELGRPAFDANGGLWIRLTVHAEDGSPISRLGYGHPDGKTGGNAIKETIGDALRNAGMRFGMALELWSKERDDYTETEGKAPEPPPVKPFHEWLAGIVAASSTADLVKFGNELARADLSDEERRELRAEFTKRMHELKEAS